MDTDHFKRKLETEKARLIDELATVGERNPDNPVDWQARPDNLATIETRDEVAEKLEDFGEREVTNLNLEARLKEINEALARIAAGTYGFCEIDQEVIESDRLEANPSARTCKKHLDAR